MDVGWPVFGTSASVIVVLGTIVDSLLDCVTNSKEVTVRSTEIFFNNLMHTLILQGCPIIQYVLVADLY